MKIHKAADEKFGTATIEEFWRLVSSVMWDSSKFASHIRNELKKMLSPRRAETMREVLQYYSYGLIVQYKRYLISSLVHNNEVDLQEAEDAASNIIGGGKMNYDEFMNRPQMMQSEIEEVHIGNNFKLAIPTESDYFYQ
jgi:hypothetical protein